MLVRQSVTLPSLGRMYCARSAQRSKDHVVTVSPVEESAKAAVASAAVDGPGRVGSADRDRELFHITQGTRLDRNMHTHLRPP